MAVQIKRVDYVKAFIDSVINNGGKIDKENLSITLPENYSDKVYWSTLEEASGLKFEEKDITSRRSKVVEAISELKFARSTFNMTAEIDGEEVHISELWIKKDDKNIVKALQDFGEETITGKELVSLIASVCNSDQKKSRSYAIWEDNKVQGNKTSDELFEPFLANESYPELKPVEIFYGEEKKGRGRKANIGAVSAIDLM